MGDWLIAIDLYCERNHSGLWAEPLNAISNASFLLAACWGAHLAIHKNGSISTYALCILAALIGAGSLLFHTAPSLLTQWVDVVPIWLFTASSAVWLVWHWCHRHKAKTLMVVMTLTAAMVIFFYIFSQWVSAKPVGADAMAWNGSIQYTPAVLLLCVFTLYAWVSGRDSRHALTIALVLFVLALFFRTVDLELCTKVPVGTHFLWHLLNGGVVVALLTACCRSDACIIRD